MAGCGGCGSRRNREKSKIEIYRNTKKLPNDRSSPTVWKPATRDMGNSHSALCPICRTPMRVINKYDKHAKITVKQRSCPNPQCSNK